jgi:hypothetical protein
MVSFAKLLRNRQGIEKKYENIGLEKISVIHLKWYCSPCLEMYKNMFDKLESFQSEIIDEIRLSRRVYGKQLD